MGGGGQGGGDSYHGGTNCSMRTRTKEKDRTTLTWQVDVPRKCGGRKPIQWKLGADASVEPGITSFKSRKVLEDLAETATRGLLAMATEEGQDMETRCVRADGREHYRSVKIRPLMWSYI